MEPCSLAQKKQISQTVSTAVRDTYWTLTTAQFFTVFHTTPNGLQQTDAVSRIKQDGTNALKEQRKNTALGLLVSQFKTPLILILIFASVVLAFVGKWTEAIIVLAVGICSPVLGFVEEYRANNAIEKLRSHLTIKSSVLRGGKAQLIPSEQVVPDDVVVLSAGSLIWISQ